MQVERSHFLIPFRLDGQNRFLVWYSDEHDGVLLTDMGAVAMFDSEPAGIAYAKAKGLSAALDTRGTWDFDAIACWAETPTAGGIECNAFYNAWNLLGDIAASVGKPLEFTEDERHIHGKLFWGCNLPAVTPSGKYFTPAWPEDEVRTLADTLLDGLRLARESMGH